MNTQLLISGTANNDDNKIQTHPESRYTHTGN